MTVHYELRHVFRKSPDVTQGFPLILAAGGCSTLTVITHSAQHATDIQRMTK